MKKKKLSSRQGPVPPSVDTEQPINVVVSKDAMDKIPKLVEDLRRTGMTVEEVMHNTGFITGSSPITKLSALRKLKGVESAEPDEIASELPLPENPVQ